jgi:selenocysteine-specific elongation factor
LAGKQAFVQLVLDKPIAAAAGDAFILRDTSAQRTLGGGRFLDLRPPARKRRADGRIAQLNALANQSSAEILRHLIALPPHFLDLTNFARDLAQFERQILDVADAQCIAHIPVAGTIYGIAENAAARLCQDVCANLEEFHLDNPDLPGIPLERLRTRLAPFMPKAAFLAFLHPLVRDKVIAIDGGWLRLAAHEVRLTAQDEKIWLQIQPHIGGEQRFRPPRVRDLSNELSLSEIDVRRVLKSLNRMGKVAEIAHDHFFLRTAVAEMVKYMIDLSDEGGHREFTAAQFRDKLDNGRKVAIQSLEFFDRHGVTIRRGDLRRINPRRLDLFGEPQESTGRAA